MSDEIEEVSILVGDNSISGWQDVNVTLRAEAFPNSFAIALTAKEPITETATVAKMGDACQVKLGDDVVITGWVDDDAVDIAAEDHTLTLVGRGKTEDLVDCSAEYGSGMISGVTALAVAQRLCSAYKGLSARLAAGADAGPTIPQLLLDYTETAAGIIQRVAQNAGLLAYEDAQGVLVLARAGTRTAASGAVYGKNVLDLAVRNSLAERFSEILCVRQSQDMLIGVTPLAGDENAFFTAPDPNVPRHRRKVIVLEQAEDPEGFTKRKAKWEVTRRAGRSTSARVTLDSWRDSDSKLWEPNTLIPVDLPGLRLPDKSLIVSEVTFHRSSERGTVADLVLMPAAAFDIEPVNLIPANLQGVVGPDGK